MAPTAVRDVEWQTSQIIKYLFEDEDDASCRQFDCHLETDGPVSEDESFDPVLIADKLRHIADTMSENPKFKAAMSDLKQAAAQEALETAFSHGVEALCKSTVAQAAEVAPELQLIRASVAVGLYIKKSTPEMKNKIQSVVTRFLNRHVEDWVTQQGGWSNVPVFDSGSH